MKKALCALTLGLMTAASASAISVTFEFEDLDLDETFNVLFTASQGDNEGLATYNVALSGLDGVLDPDSFTWAENVLGNFDSVTFLPQGIQASSLLEGSVGTNGYSATNTQFQSADAIFSIGQAPVFEANNPIIPTDADVDLGVPALLGTLTIPGANGLSDEALNALLSPNAALFTNSADTGEVAAADEVVAFVNRIPEPSTVLLAGLALVGFAARRR